MKIKFIFVIIFSISFTTLITLSKNKYPEYLLTEEEAFSTLLNISDNGKVRLVADKTYPLDDDDIESIEWEREVSSKKYEPIRILLAELIADFLKNVDGNLHETPKVFIEDTTGEKIGCYGYAGPLFFVITGSCFENGNIEKLLFALSHELTHVVREHEKKI